MPEIKKPCRIALLNPNTSLETTQMMLGIARRALPAFCSATLEGRTVPSGESLIVDERALGNAALVVENYGMRIAWEGFNAIIISGFGDPGLMALRERLHIPVTGLAEAGIAEAAAGGRRYAIVTTTPELHNSLQNTAERYGHAGSLVSIRITTGDLMNTMRDLARMTSALMESCRQAIELDGAEAIVIGGGPLASAARIIAPQLGVPVIEPIPAAVRLTLQRGLVA